ncbi:MAG: hypothetical protein WBP12_04650 [Candidatus Saccharimonas sp.]
MAVPVVNGYTSASTSGGSSSFTIDPSANVLSGGVSDGDWIFAVFTSASNTAALNIPTPPAGWTNIVPLVSVGSGTMSFGVWVHKRQVGETTYSWTQTTGQNGTYSRLIFVGGADDVGAWTIGSFDFRQNTGTTTTNVAASITTTTNDSLALLLSGERTVTAESDAQVTCTNFTKLYFNNPVDHSLFVAVKSISTVASTGSSTVTYPNTHSFNGIAGIIGVTPFDNGAAIMWVT